MIRRFILWTAILFVLLGSGLTGHRSAAQEDGPHLLMIVYDRELESGGGRFLYTLYLQDPLTGETWPLSIEQFRRYLQRGNIYYDPQLYLYHWPGGGTQEGVYADIVAGEYTWAIVYESYALPSPDWNWVVYWMDYHVYAVNLDEGIPCDLFAAHGLTQYVEYFSVAFSPDGETIYVSAKDAEGNDGLYRLRLDGNDEPGVQPIAQTNLMPMMWLEGTDSFVATRYEIAQGNLEVSIVGSDGSLKARFTKESFDNFPDEVRFEGWIPLSQTYILSVSRNSYLLGYRWTDDFLWRIENWWPLGMTADREWLILYGGNQLARIRTDGSLFEVVTDIAEGFWHHTTYSPNGDSVSKWTFDGSNYRLYLADMVARQVTEINLGSDYVSVGVNNWSPDGKWLVYGTGNYESTRTVITDVHGNVVREYINDEQSHYFLTWVTLDDLP